MIQEHQRVEVFIGLDVGKSEHHALAVDRAGKVLYDKALPNDEEKLRAILARLAVHGPVLMVVDQPATIGALVGYLPGLSMRRIADLHPGNAKTDARDALIIADAARTMPHTLRSIDLADEQIAGLSMLCGCDDDLRGLLAQIHPALQRVVGKHLDHPAVLDLIQTWPTPADRKTAGTRRIATRLTKRAPRMGARLAEGITAALAEQSVVVAGTRAAGVVLPHLAAQLAELRSQREDVATKVEELVYDHPLYLVLMWMPGNGIRTTARLLTEFTGKGFTSAAHMAFYAGLAPVTRRSGTSIRGERPNRAGNKVLKRALFLAAFAALSDPTSRAYYDRKRAEDKRHNQALIALARRRCDVLYAMLRDGALYEPPQPLAA